MKKYSIYCIICALVMSMTSCHDIIEEDIGDKTIHVILPSDSLVSSTYKQVFKWDAVSGVLKYRIQIVSPDFKSALTIVSDTTITTTQFSKTLDPGKYQWKIWAVNGNYKTNAQTYTLQILQADLNKQTVTLKMPADNYFQQSLNFKLTWDRIPGATKYLVEIDTAFANFSPPLYSQEVTGETTNFYNKQFLKEGTYIWRVTAKNSGDETPPSSAFTLGTFTSKPKPPVPLTPDNGLSTSSPVTFTWSAGPDGRSDKYNLYIYKSDTTIAPIKTALIVGTSKSMTFTPASQTIYWRVSTTDKAGNESTLSYPYRKLSTN